MSARFDDLYSYILNNPKSEISTIAKAFNISRNTIYRFLESRPEIFEVEKIKRIKSDKRVSIIRVFSIKEGQTEEDLKPKQTLTNYQPCEIKQHPIIRAFFGIN